MVICTTRGPETAFEEVRPLRVRLAVLEKLAAALTL
jgi:hypothetical protein